MKRSFSEVGQTAAPSLSGRKVRTPQGRVSRNPGSFRMVGMQESATENIPSRPGGIRVKRCGLTEVGIKVRAHRPVCKGGSQANPTRSKSKQGKGIARSV